MAPAYPPEQLAHIVEFVRAQRNDLSLEDVMVLAERMAESLDGTMERIDTLLHDEFQSIIGEIGSLRRDIGGLRPDHMRFEKIPEAGSELDAVVEATELATGAIMTAAEDIMAADASDSEAFKALVDDRMIVIFEACSFQDITGQRIAKVVKTLGWIEERLGMLSRTLKLSNVEGEAPPETDAERRDRELLLHGPQMKGEGVDQSMVDDFFAPKPKASTTTSDQNDIDALFD
ncbi:chemotaxis protein [Siculibacillus lacustris]|uniref:chemotaxis protein n=1 Tax=Siculibacillus lacustris TaxID=1549641 RepID=UPI0019D213FA|nr:chemotaxis protein [Siculibacillus lacustris]